MQNFGKRQDLYLGSYKVGKTYSLSRQAIS